MANTISNVLFIATWIAGIVIAKGWWLKAAAVFFFPYAWYLLAERLMQIAGIV